MLIRHMKRQHNGMARPSGGGDRRRPRPRPSNGAAPGTTRRRSLVLALALIVLAATMWAAPPNAANDTAVAIHTGAIYRAQHLNLFKKVGKQRGRPSRRVCVSVTSWH